MLFQVNLTYIPICILEASHHNYQLISWLPTHGLTASATLEFKTKIQYFQESDP